MQTATSSWQDSADRPGYHPGWRTDRRTLPEFFVQDYDAPRRGSIRTDINGVFVPLHRINTSALLVERLPKRGNTLIDDTTPCVIVDSRIAGDRTRSTGEIAWGGEDTT